MSCEVNNNCIPLMPTYVENALPANPVKTAIYFIKNGGIVKMYVTDASGNPYLINPSIPEHNLLTGLQGGQAGQYYHLTQAEYQQIQNIIGEGFVLTVNGISPDLSGNVSVNADSVFEENSNVNVSTPINLVHSGGTGNAALTLDSEGTTQLSGIQVQVIGDSIDFTTTDGTTVPTINVTDNIVVSVNGIGADTQGNINLTWGSQLLYIAVANTDTFIVTELIGSTQVDMISSQVAGNVTEGYSFNSLTGEISNYPVLIGEKHLIFYK